MDIEIVWENVRDRLLDEKVRICSLTLNGETRVYFQGAWLDDTYARGTMRYTVDDLCPGVIQSASGQS